MEMSTLRLPPDPGSLSESLRGMGYTLPTAVSDIIDNSISAEAKTISISMIKADEEVEASLKILDDGIGMTRDELVFRADRLPCKGVKTERVSRSGPFGEGERSG